MLSSHMVRPKGPGVVFRKYLYTLSPAAVAREGAPRKAWWAHADEVQRPRATAGCTDTYGTRH